MKKDRYIKKVLWSASKLAFYIVDGKLPEDYKTRNDYIFEDISGNCYQRAEFTGDVYSYTGGAGSIHAGLVGSSKAGIIIALRGTDGNETEIGSLLDWANNFLAMQVPFEPFGKGSVHLGFYNAVLSIKDSIIEKTRELILRQQRNGKGLPAVYVTGHSKGGAMASIMAKILEQQIKGNVIVCTFGAPRSGDEIFRANYGILHYRYESFLDLVPHLYFSKQELDLIPRLGVLYQILEPLLTFPAYTSLGKGICIYKPRGKFGLLPWNTTNKLEEKLNSFCAVDQVIQSGEINLFADAHGKDYY